MEQKPISSDQLIENNYGNVDYWIITFSNQTIFVKKGLKRIVI